jgi:hypothetical protein
MCIPFGVEVERACQRRAATSVHIARHVTIDPPGEHEWTVKQVAAALDISTHVVYYWLETSQLEARKGPGSRWLITYNPDVEEICRTRIAASGHLGRLDSDAS